MGISQILVNNLKKMIMKTHQKECATVATAQKLSFKVNDVPSAFKNLPETGVYEKFKHLPYFSNIGVEHVQGYTQYQNGNGVYSFFSHHTAGDYGYILIAKGTDNKESIKKIPLEKGWNHPGGIQAVGQYLFVPCEKGNESKIFIYDMEAMREVKTIGFANHRAGSIGITYFNKNGKNYYLMLVGANQIYYGYIAEIPEDMSNIAFSDAGSIDLSEKGHDKKNIDCQGFGLMTDSKDGAVYMVGLVSHGYRTTYADWAYLMKININDKVSYDVLSERHLKNKGGISGVDGSHFRWGAGIRITPNSKLVVLATSRNIIAGTKLDTTYWSK